MPDIFPSFLLLQSKIIHWYQALLLRITVLCSSVSFKPGFVPCLLVKPCISVSSWTSSSRGKQSIKISSFLNLLFADDFGRSCVSFLNEWMCGFFSACLNLLIRYGIGSVVLVVWLVYLGSCLFTGYLEIEDLIHWLKHEGSSTSGYCCLHW